MIIIHNTAHHYSRWFWYSMKNVSTFNCCDLLHTITILKTVQWNQYRNHGVAHWTDCMTAFPLTLNIIYSRTWRRFEQFGGFTFTLWLVMMSAWKVKRKNKNKQKKNAWFWTLLAPSIWGLDIWAWGPFQNNDNTLHDTQPFWLVLIYV